MATTAGHRLTLDPMGKCSNAFFSETTNMIKAKLYMNVLWVVLYKLDVFCSDMKLKMAATAGLSLTLDPMGKMFQNASSLKPLGQLKPNCPAMIIGRSSTKFLFFYDDRKFKMATTAGHRLTLDPMGKCSNAFFSETTNMIKAKLYMNVHWKVLYKVCVFYDDRKFKMAATAGHRLTLDPMGKCSNAFSETTNMIKAKLYMNVHWMFLYNLKVFCSDMKFKMAATAGLSLTLDPMGKMFQNASSLKPLGQLKPNCSGMIIGMSFTKLLAQE